MNNEHQNFGRNASSNLSSSSTTNATSSSKFSSTTTKSTSSSSNTHTHQQQGSPFNYIVGGSSSLSSASSSPSACVGSINAIVAAIIPDTPIVSIAGATQLSDITTTTTSTTTTPTPTATPTTYGPASSASIGGNTKKTTAIGRNSRNKKIPADPKANPMSDANAVEEAAAQATITANDIDENTTTAQTNDDSHNTITTTELDETPTTTEVNESQVVEEQKDSATTTTTNTTPANTTEEAATVKEDTTTASASNNNSPGATAATASACNEVKSKQEFAKPTAPKEISDMHDDDLKNLLEEAYSYKNPCDKENKSEAFLHLLKQAENADDYISPFPPITSRYTRNSTSSSTSSGGHGGHHGHHHHHNHHKQGGSLQNLDNVVDHNDSDFGRHQNSSSIGVGGASGGGGRQKKFSSVSSRQREGGSLPSNVNASSSLLDQQSMFAMFERLSNASTAAAGTATNKQQRRNAKAKSDSEKDKDTGSSQSATTTTTTSATLPISSTSSTGGGNNNNNTPTVAPFVGSAIPVLTTSSNTAYIEDADNDLIIALSLATPNGPNDPNENGAASVDTHVEPTAAAASSASPTSPPAATPAKTPCVNAGDCVIELGETLIEIQQKHQILQAKPHGIIQGLPYYDRTESTTTRSTRNVAKAIPIKTDFAPTMAQSYVDETVAFERGAFALNSNDSCAVSASTSAGGTSGAAATVSELSSGGGGGAAAEPLPGCAARSVLNAEGSYLPLDENYKSCKSVLGEKGDFTPKTALSSVFAASKTRQFDENGNSLSEISAGLSVSKTPNLYNIAGGCIGSQLSDSLGTSLSNPTTSNSTPLVSIGPSQMKTKSKKKSQQERNTKTVDVASVAGYRGNDSIEELVKYIENTDDKQPGSALGSKFDKKKERKNKDKDKDKHDKQQKMKKSNSLEELRSCSKIIVDDDLKRKAATTESNVMMRPSGKGAAKKNNNSSSTADINKNFDHKETGTATGKITANHSAAAGSAGNNNRKGERRSWGTEELQYLGDQSTVVDEKVAAAGNKRSKGHRDTKDPKDTEKENNLSNSLLALSRDHRFGDKQSNVLVIGENDKVTATGIIAVPLLANSGVSSFDKHDKPDKRKKGDGNGPVILAPTSKGPTGITVDLYALAHNEAVTKDADRLATETAEFHVVTKKKKAKKQKSAFTGVGGSAQTATGLTQGGGGDDARGAAATASTSTTSNAPNNNSKMNNVTMIGHHQQQRYNNKYNNVYNEQHQQQQRAEYQHHAQQHRHHNQVHAAGGQANHQHAAQPHATDKSRRKSTSSMPPSEKSDSSDLDSVHSLPIEKTTTTKNKPKQKQQADKAPHATSGGKKNQSAPAAAAAAATTPAQISYADIARINREKAAAAAKALEKSTNAPEPASTVSVASAEVPTASMTNNTQTVLVVAAGDQHTAQQHQAATAPPQQLAVEEDNNAAAVGSPIPVIVNCIATYPTLATKAKGKRSASKPDFPELVASSNTAAAPDAPLGEKSKTGGGISYSQSLANPVVVNATNTAPPPPPPTTTATTVEVAQTAAAAVETATLTPHAAEVAHDGHKKEHKPEKRKEAAAILKTPEATTATAASSTSAPAVAAKTKSYNDTDSSPVAKAASSTDAAPTAGYTFMDQQYPALGKNVKRSAAVATTSTAAAVVVGAAAASATQFNFAAAAKQQINVHNEAAHVAIASTTTTTLPPAAAAPTTTTVQPAAIPTTTSGSSNSSNNNNNTKKAKEKSPTLAGALSFSEAVVANANANPPAMTAKKHKKDNKQQQQQVEQQIAAIVETPTVEPFTRSWSQMTQEDDDEQDIIVAHTTVEPDKSTTSTQTTATSGATTNPQLHGTSTESVGSAVVATAMAPPPKPIRTTVSAATSTTSLVAAAAAVANRPAVIIMNDDRLSAAGGTGDTEFTFGDFNEGEITFFDDDEKTADEDEEPELGDSADLEDSKERLPRQTVISITKNAANQSPSGCFNDSGVSADPAVTLQHAGAGTDDMVIVVSANDASSPNSSYGHTQIGGLVNQSSDSGIYTVLPKGGPTTLAEQPSQKRPAPSPQAEIVDEVAPPLAGGVHPTQQFETCNQIESAIIAAACQAAEGGPMPMAVPQPPVPQATYHRAGAPANSYTVTASSYTSGAVVATNPSGVAMAYPATIQSPPPGTLVVAPHALPVAAAAHMHRQAAHPPQGQYIAYHPPPYPFNHVPPEFYAAGAPIIVSNEELAPPPPHVASTYGRSRTNSRNNNYYYYNHHHHHQAPPPHHHHHQSHHHQAPSHHHQQPFMVTQVSEESYDVMESRTPTPPPGPAPEPEPAPAPAPAPAVEPVTEGVLVGPNKEFRIKIRHPNNQPTENSRQSQDYVVDFIGSSWEKIANSKNTRVYDDTC